MKRWLLFVLVVAPIVYLLGFGLTRNPRELPSVLVGKRAPDFSLKTLDGKRLTSQSILGAPLVVNFWATWCGPCFYEHPVLKKGREIYRKEGIQFLGVVYQDEEKEVRRYAQKLGEPFMVLFDPESKMAIDYGVAGVPETFFVDANGIIRAKYAGILTLDILKEQIEKIR